MPSAIERHVPDDPEVEAPKPWLWLFSSNARALYAQDVSNVAGLPPGAIYRFRYRRDWVGAQARAAWETENLVGTEALVVFSFQHPKQLHPPAFVPIRKAHVVASEIVGTFFVVDFELGEYVALPEHSRRPGDGHPAMGQRAQSFTSEVEKRLTEGWPGSDPSRSAVFAPDSSDLLAQNPPLEMAWERTIEYLAASGTFPEHTYLRALRLEEVGGGDVNAKGGRFDVHAGKTYVLHLTHYQPEPFATRRHLEVVVEDEAIDVQGSKQLTLGSGYDSMRVRFQAVYRDEPKDTTLTVEPGSGEDGTRIDIPLRVHPQRSEKALRAGIGATALLAAAAPGAWKDFDGGALVGALGVIALGAIATGWLANRSRLKLPRR